MEVPGQIPQSKVCIVCKKPCIAMCPYCNQHVHPGYGLHNDNCSGQHEQKCSGAAWSRQAESKRV